MPRRPKSEQSGSEGEEAAQLGTPEQEELRRDIQTYKDLETLALSAGGKILITSWRRDVVSAVDRLARGYRKLSHVELIALCAELEAKLDQLRALSRSGENKRFAEEALAEALAE